MRRPTGRTQRCSSFGVLTSSLRPRDRCPRDTALAATPGTGQPQTGAYGIPSAERYGAIVPESTRSGIKPARPSPVRSSFAQQLLVPPYRLSTVGRRSFSVAAFTFWNTLPNDIQSAPSLSSFRRQLKTFLFHQSFNDISSNFLYCAFVDFATV